MITYYVSQQAVALGLSDSEKMNAESLVKTCLREHGLSPWERTELELFLAAGESLLIARPGGPRTQRLARHTPRLSRL